MEASECLAADTQPARLSHRRTPARRRARPPACRPRRTGGPSGPGGTRPAPATAGGGGLLSLPRGCGGGRGPAARGRPSLVLVIAPRPDYDTAESRTVYRPGPRGGRAESGTERRVRARPGEIPRGPRRGARERVPDTLGAHDHAHDYRGTAGGTLYAMPSSSFIPSSCTAGR